MTSATRDQAEPPFDPFDPNHFLDPFDRLREARERCPVSRIAPDAIFVAGYEPAVAVLRDFRSYSNEGNFQIEHNPDPPTIVQVDPPRHNQLRKLISTALNPRVVADAEPFVRRVAADLVASFASDRRVELMASYCRPLPAIVIARLVGVPEADWQRFTDWTAEITANVPFSFQQLDAWRDFKSYIHGAIDDRRRSAQPPDDIITRLIEAEVEGSRLTDDEIRMSIFQLIVAGNDTTTRLIGNCVFELLRTGLWERVLIDRSLVEQAVAESLRHDSPIQWVMRKARTAGELNGIQFHEGDRVLVGVASANRDESRWNDAAEFRLDRPPDGHLAFGFGRHLCLGAPLGELEGRIALETLLDRLPSARLCPDYRYEMVPAAMMRGPKRLDLCW
jgi:cytochrome P450